MFSQQDTTSDGEHTLIQLRLGSTLPSLRILLPSREKNPRLVSAHSSPHARPLPASCLAPSPPLSLPFLRRCLLTFTKNLPNRASHGGRMTRLGARPFTFLTILFKDDRDEAHFPTQQSRACAPSRFPHPHGNPRWPQGYPRAPRPWPQGSFRVILRAIAHACRR